MMTRQPAQKRPGALLRRGVVFVHGHRLSSLYRGLSKLQNSYKTLNVFVPKILRGAGQRPAGRRGGLAYGVSISRTKTRSLA